MSIFERIPLVLRSNLSSLLTRAEDPEKVLDQLMEDMNTEFVDAKKQVALAIADERKLHRQVEKAREEAVAWENKAAQALNANREDLARSAMERKIQFTQLVRNGLKRLFPDVVPHASHQAGGAARSNQERNRGKGKAPRTLFPPPKCRKRIRIYDELLSNG